MHPHHLPRWRVLFLLLFLTHIVCLCHLSDVRSSASLTTFSSSCSCLRVRPLSTLRMVSSILQRDRPGVYQFDEISAAELGFKNLSRLSEVFFYDFFFHLHVFDRVRFNISTYL